MKSKNLIEETKEFFGVLYPYVCDDEITDDRRDMSILIHSRNALKSYFVGVEQYVWEGMGTVFISRFLEYTL